MLKRRVKKIADNLKEMGSSWVVPLFEVRHLTEYFLGEDTANESGLQYRRLYGERVKIMRDGLKTYKNEARSNARRVRAWRATARVVCLLKEGSYEFKKL